MYIYVKLSTPVFLAKINTHYDSKCEGNFPLLKYEIAHYKMQNRCYIKYRTLLNIRNFFTCHTSRFAEVCQASCNRMQHATVASFEL